MTESSNTTPSHVLVFDALHGSPVLDQGASIRIGTDQPVQVRLEITSSSALLSVIQQVDLKMIFNADLASDSVCRIFGKKFIISKSNESEAYCLICSSEIEASRLNAALQGAQSSQVGPLKQSPEIGSWSQTEDSWFDKKTEKSSSDLYFHYYGTLQHQQNMLQDCIRTGTYYMAFVNNTVDFQGKLVMDVGAGTGMLSLFAAQAGARKVLAVEASPMARFARRLVQRNSVLGAIPSVEVIESKIEELELNEKVDVLISEPIGTLLVNERMLETYIFARDHFLKPGGKMFPTLGRIHVAAFSDDVLYQEILSRATFWSQSNFYGVDLTSLHQDALNQYFTQVVVDAFDPSLLVSNVAVHPVNFATIAEKELYDLSIPLSYSITRPCVVHGVGCWFDLFFNGSAREVCLTTAPGTATTHWFQLRCVLPQPLCVVGGSRIIGELRLQAHSKQSYTITLVLEVLAPAPGIPSQKVEYSYDLKEPYYRQLMNCWQPPAPTTLPVGEAAYYSDNHLC